LFGPLAGVGVVWMVLIGLNILTGDPGWTGDLPAYLAGLLGLLLLTVVFGYVLGVVPAAVTGLICHFFARAIRSDALWILACALAGATVSMAALAVTTGSSDLLNYTSLLLFVAPGTGAGAVCAWKLRRSRWA